MLQNVASKILKGNPSDEYLIVKNHRSKDGPDFRYVKPFPQQHSIFAKGRMVGLKLSEGYSVEYSMPMNRCIGFVSKGLITVNAQQVDPDYIVRHQDVLAFIHPGKTEPASLYFDQIEVIHEDDDFFVVNKPSSIPIHQSGRYLKNTVISILEKEYGIEDLKCVHRLDRVTSGILIFAKSTKIAGEFREMFVSGMIRKYYLARVNSEFLSDLQHVKNHFFCSDPRKGKWSNVSDENHLIELKKSLSPSLIKDAETYFQRIGYDRVTNQSLVFCAPVTGRTHQLRNHMKLLGHVIINDDYNESKKLKSSNHWEKCFDDESRFLGIDPIDEEPDPEPESMQICLHALKYETKDWFLMTNNLPMWTKDFDDVMTRCKKIQDEINVIRDKFVKI